MKTSLIVGIISGILLFGSLSFVYALMFDCLNPPVWMKIPKSDFGYCWGLFVNNRLPDYPNYATYEEYRDARDTKIYGLPNNGIYLNYNDNSYTVNQKISFYVISVSDVCEETFDAKIINYDYSKVLWQESSSASCITVGNQKISKADFPIKNQITIDEAGEYRVEVGRLHLGTFISEHFMVTNELRE